MLTADLFSPSALLLIVCAVDPADSQVGEATSSCFVRSLSGSYSHPSFQSLRTMAAHLRAMVSLARFGFVPAASSRW